MIVKGYSRIKNNTEVLLKCSLSYNENKMGMVNLLCLSAKNYFLRLLTRVQIKTHFPLKSQVFNR